MVDKEILKKKLKKDLSELNLSSQEEDKVINELIILSDLLIDIALKEHAYD